MNIMGKRACTWLCVAFLCAGPIFGAIAAGEDKNVKG